MFFLLFLGIPQAADSSSASFNKSRCVGSKLSGPQKRMWPLDCQTGFRLWSVSKHWNTMLFPLWWKYTIPCISDHSYLSSNRNKQNKTKPWVPCWCQMRVPHIHPLTHWRGRNLPRTHNVLSENTGQPDLFSLDHSFNPTLTLTLSCLLSDLLLRARSLAHLSSLPPVASGHCPMVTKSFSPSWIYPNSWFQPRQLEYLWHNT